MSNYKTSPTTNGVIHELPCEESRELLDREARRYVGISGEEFIHAWEGGKFDEDPDRPDAMCVAMLIPFTR